MKIEMLGRVDLEATARAMERFTAERGADTPDELWLCEHPGVYTQGVAGRAEHLRADDAAHGGHESHAAHAPDTAHAAHGIPVVATNRGGQVTYHGPGQVVAYPLVDLRRLGVYVKEYVFRLEAAVLKALAEHGVTGHRVPGAPGIYVRLADPFGHAVLRPEEHPHFRGLGKIAALGIKVSRHCAYHGVALNVAMDLRPFGRIDPCGYPGLEAIDLARLGICTDWHTEAARLAQRLAAQLTP